MKAVRFFKTQRLAKRSSLTLVCALLTLACDEKPRLGSGGGYVGGDSKSTASTKQPEKKLPPAEEEEEEEDAEKQAGATKPTDAGPPPEYGELTKLWKLGELRDLGPAGPATATDKGVYFVTRADQVALVKRKGADDFETLDVPREYFAKYGWGPSISATHAYWISERNLLLRVPLKGGKAQVLYDHARQGTRTSVVTAAGRDVVAFIAELEGKPYAYVWGDKGSKGELLRITPEGATASSVALVEGDPHPRAIVLAGRLGMSPVHVRRIRTTKKRLTLEPDEVVWVGPGSHVLTEIHAIRTKDDHAVAFLPTAKDFNDFGLAQLEIASEPGEIDEPEWHIYKNGLDPAPVATAKICGKPYVLYAKPTEARPRSPQELHLVEILDHAPEEGEIIARSRAFNDIHLAPTKDGAIATWTADHRTWGMVMSCPDK